MIRFIHLSDIHFGVENYGKIDPKTGIHSRLLDFKKSLDTCISYAIEENVDLVVFSGDAYKTSHPSPTQQKLLMNSFMRLYKSNIPVVITVGNHDNPLSYGKANSLDIFAHLPIEGFHVFSKPGIEVIKTKSGNVQIVGIPWPNRHTIALSNTHYAQSVTELTKQLSESLAIIIQALASKLDQNMPSILVGHLTVSSGVFSGSEKRAVYGQDPIVLPSQLAIKPFDYIALGHLHRYQNLNPNGDIPIVYSGSIDRIDFGERKEDKGFCDVTIEQKYKTNITFIKINTRKFIQIDVILNEEVDQTEQIISAIKQHEIKDEIVKITYKILEHVQDVVDIKKIQTHCSQVMYLVGIFPIKSVQARLCRNILQNEMNLETLLKTYFLSQDSLKKRTDILTEKAMRLDELVENKDSESIEEN